MPRNSWSAILVDQDPRGFNADGLTLASFTTSAAIFPPFILPANFWRSRGLRLRASGIWAATATPTYTFRLQQTAPAAVTIITSAAITVSALTNQQWGLDLKIQARSEGTAGTVEAMGSLDLANVTGKQWLPAAGTAPATAAIDTTQAETWQLEIACSASSASNTVKGLDLELLVLN